MKPEQLENQEQEDLPIESFWNSDVKELEIKEVLPPIPFNPLLKETTKTP